MIPRCFVKHDDDDCDNDENGDVQHKLYLKWFKKRKVRYSLAFIN